MNNCGTCSLCCKLLNVPDLAPPGQWCNHTDPGNPSGGCQIHDTRPDICRGYDCAYRLGAELPRPSRCGIIFEEHAEHKFLTALVDPHKREQLNRRSVRAYGIEYLKKGYFIWFIIGTERHLMLPKPETGVTEQKAHEITRAAYTQKLKDSMLPWLLEERNDGP